MADSHETVDSVRPCEAGPLREKSNQNFVRSTIKRRSRIACLPCRTRKVRCDAAQQENAPCTNCRLDKETCLIQNRVRQSKIAHQQTFNLSTKTGCAAWSALRKASAQPSLPSPSSDGERLENSEMGESRQRLQSDLLQQSDKTDLEELIRGPTGSSTHAPLPSLQDRGEPNPAREHYDLEDTPGFTSSALSTQESSLATNNPDIGYFYYQFLVVDMISQLPLEDMQYLESLSCFRIPLKPLLDELMRAYFRYIHSHLPLFNEVEFWKTYTNPTLSSESKISIFVFQAMLSVACSFVPLSTIHRLGFDSIRSARASFYSRAKALFHIETQRDVLSSAQGALLLTYYVSATDARLNTYWLSNAICFARMATAHVYQALDSTPARQRLLKRLWWCCWVRDTNMSLALRRPLQLGPKETYSPLPEKGDFDSEIEGSMVYDSTTKQELMGSFIALCKLVVILTDVVDFLSLQRGEPHSWKASQIPSQPQVYSNRLDEWFESTKANFQSYSHTHESVSLHRNVIYVYYHASKAALWNHAIYMSVIGRSPIHINLSQSRLRLESALRGIDDSLNLIQQVGLIQHMPIAIVAFVALPLVWHIISTKLSHGNDSRERRTRLSVYFNALSALKLRSAGTERVLNHIRQLVTCFQTPENRSSSQQLNGRLSSHAIPKMNDWADILISQPQYFIRTTLTVELALSLGQFPTEANFPTSLSSSAQNIWSSRQSAQPACERVVEEIPELPQNDSEGDTVFTAPDYPPTWVFGTGETHSRESADFSTQAILQDVLFRLEQTDHDFFNRCSQNQSPAITDAACLDELFTALESI